MNAPPSGTRDDTTLDRYASMRLVMLGTLTAGLGHELRNLVMPLMLRLDVLEARAQLSREALDDVIRIRRCVAQLHTLADSLQLISTDPFERAIDAHEVSVGDFAHRIRTLAPSVLPRHVVLELDLAENLPAISVPAAALAESLLGILTRLASTIPLAPDAAVLPRVTISMRESVDGVVVEIAHDVAVGAAIGSNPETLQPGALDLPVPDDDPALGIARALLMPHGGSVKSEYRHDHARTVRLVLPAARVPFTSTSRRVRVDITDPRRLAAMRHLLQASGWHAVAEHDAPPIDLIVCDVHQLDTLSIGPNGHYGNSPSTRVLALGVRPETFENAQVEFVEVADAAQLSEALRRLPQ